jgi:undecaprenyl-diphosphatase
MTLNHIILGILQGIFEWIPVSSEGVVAIAGNFLIPDINAVDLALFLHLGTIFAVLFYFKNDWKDVLLLKNKRLLNFLIITTIISLIIGFFVYQFVKTMAVGSGLLLITGFGLLITAFFHKKKIMFNVGNNKSAVFAGIMQGLAAIPGFSRSGSTIFALSLAKNSPQNILKLSYMMSAPVVFASSFYLYLKNPVKLYEGWPALIISFIVGFFSLKLLMNISQKINFFRFALIFSILCFLGAGISFL